MGKRDHLQIVNDESEADDDYFGGYLGDCCDDDDDGYDFDYDLRRIHCSLWNHRHHQKTNQTAVWSFSAPSVAP